MISFYSIKVAIIYLMDNLINKNTLKYLAELSRIELKEQEEEKILKDLQKILDYFNLLKEIDTENVEPMMGGTIAKNIFREEEEKFKKEKLTEQFLENQDNFLKIPPVFE